MDKFKNKVINFLLLLILLLLPLNTFAETCSKEVTNEIYNKIKSIKYEFNHLGNNNFSITFYNMPNDIIIYDTGGTEYISNNNTATGGNYQGGRSYKFSFLPNYEINCDLDISTDQNIYIKKYNLFADRKECENIDYNEFQLCNPDYQGIINEDTFQKELSEYKNSLIKEEETNIENNTDSTNNPFNINMILIISIVVIIFIIILIIIFRTIKRKRRIL